MPSIVDAMLHFFPAASQGRDYVVSDPGDGQGPRISEWLLPGSPPTPAELAAVTAEQVAAALAARAAAAAKAEVVAPAGSVQIAVTALGLVLNGALNEIRQRVNEIDARTGGTGDPLSITTADQGRALIQAAIDALLGDG